MPGSTHSTSGISSPISLWQCSSSWRWKRTAGRHRRGFLRVPLSGSGTCCRGAWATPWRARCSRLGSGPGPMRLVARRESGRWSGSNAELLVMAYLAWWWNLQFWWVWLCRPIQSSLRLSWPSQFSSCCRYRCTVNPGLLVSNSWISHFESESLCIQDRRNYDK